jgi:site-specific recombinase XerD
MCKNPNHPEKGSSIKVEPIRSKADIERIKSVLIHAGKYRDHCLFTFGINTAHRANELLSITAGQVAHLRAGDILKLKQSKNRKHRAVTINRNAAETIRLYLENDSSIRARLEKEPEAPLFY